MLPPNKPHLIEGVGWRRDVEHSMKRWPSWKDATLPGTYMLTLTVAGKQPILGTIQGSTSAIRDWLSNHPSMREQVRHTPLPALTALLGSRPLPYVLPSSSGPSVLPLSSGPSVLPSSSGPSVLPLSSGPSVLPSSLGSSVLPLMAEGKPSSPSLSSPSPSASSSSSLPHFSSIAQVVPSIPVAAFFSEGAPHLVPSPLGLEVQTCFCRLSEQYPQIELVQLQLMPNHLHAILAVHSKLPKHLGSILRSLMGGCTSALRRLLHLPSHSGGLSPVGGAPADGRAVATPSLPGRVFTTVPAAGHPSVLPLMAEEKVPSSPSSPSVPSSPSSPSSPSAPSSPSSPSSPSVPSSPSSPSVLSSPSSPSAPLVHWSFSSILRQQEREEARMEMLMRDYGLDRQRLASQRRKGREQTPERPSLWEEGYCLTALPDASRLDAALAYNLSNPYFYCLEHERLNFMGRRHHITLASTHFAAYGNLLLLKEPERLQVFCHRKARLGQLTPDEATSLGYDPSYCAAYPNYCSTLDYTATRAFSLEKGTLIERCRQGAVLVTPGISPGERDIMLTALYLGLPVIMLQKDPILRPDWHPAKSLRTCCTDGILLILAPWQYDVRSYTGAHGDTIPSTTDYARFHSLNELAAQLCAPILYPIFKPE